MDIEKLINNAKFLIFDFDGTIADTSTIHEKAFKKVFESFCININYKEISGKSTKEAISHLIKMNDLEIKAEDIKKLIKNKQSFVREEIISSPNFKTLPYVREFIENVYGNYQLAIASSGSRETINLAIKKLNLKKYFNLILCSEDVEHSKPSPDIFLKVIQLANYKREDSLIFEDSQSGLQASMAARIPFIDINIYPFKKTINYLN